MQRCLRVPGVRAVHMFAIPLYCVHHCAYTTCSIALHHYAYVTCSIIALYYCTVLTLLTPSHCTTAPTPLVPSHCTTVPTVHAKTKSIAARVLSTMCIAIDDVCGLRQHGISLADAVGKFLAGANADRVGVELGMPITSAFCKGQGRVVAASFLAQHCK